MSEAYKKIAEGLKLMAEGYEVLAAVDTATVPETKEPKKTDKKTSVKEQDTETQKEKTTTPADTEQAPFDRDTVLAEIRAVMSPKCKEGKTEQCQALLREYGVPNLSNIPYEKLLEFKSRAEVL
jgi:archaellum component FlaD/FlaE